jgi:hypothetical protein
MWQAVVGVVVVVVAAGTLVSAERHRLEPEDGRVIHAIGQGLDWQVQARKPIEKNGVDTHGVPPKRRAADGPFHLHGVRGANMGRWR